ncbi:MAG: L,D-transpeptidase [Bacteroidetes bacterium]|nr:L,D-transpeptidase [Bacteroidota bacterium]
MLLRAFIIALFLSCAVQPRAQQLAAALPGSGERVHSAATSEADSAPVFYVVERGVRVYSEPGGSHSSRIALNIRDAVRVLSEEDGWSHIEWNNRRGYVPTSALSNLWIRVDKSDRLVYVYKGAELIRTYPVDVSISDEDKVRLSGRNEQDHWRIPEGVFFVARKNPNSRYYRAFVISYPNQAHAARGLRDGLISRGEYDAIVRADMAFREPPMGTPLGGLIEIHGNGSGRQRAWTRGCIALRNVHMSELWDWVHVGTPVIIEQ